MSQSKALQPIEQKAVDFYGDELTAARADDGHVYVSVAQMCSALGIDTQAQTRRIRRQEILADGFKGVANLATPGGRQTAYMLRVDLVPLWLSGIRTSAVSENIRPKLKQFQREAAAVLWEAFQEGRLTADPAFDDLLISDHPSAQAYRMARAVMTMARQQLLLESRVVGVEGRLEAIEAQLGEPGRKITTAQATNISQAVKAVAMALSKASGRNEYGGVYGELYRRYEVPGYRELPVGRYDDAMSWLNEWLQSISGEGPF
jgi:hypothetical protein